MSFCLRADIQDDAYYKRCVAQYTASHCEVFHVDFQEIFIVDADASFESVNSRIRLLTHHHTSIHMQIVCFDVLCDREALGKDRFAVEVCCVKEGLIPVHVDKKNICWYLLVIINGYYIAWLEVLYGYLSETKNAKPV